MDVCSNISVNKTSDSELKINLDNPHKVYFAGEMVSGRVHFQPQENQVVQILSVYLRGEYYYQKGDSEYMENIFVESTPSDFGGAGEGNIESQFSLILRPNSPSSIASHLGGIRYRILATLVFREHGRLRNVEKWEMISVNSPKQLPEDNSSRRVSTIERVGLLCCVGSISSEIDINRIFLLSGQTVQVSACIFNGTHSSVVSTSISLIQIVQRRRDMKKLKRIALTKQRGAILPGKRQVWLAETFEVPPLPPTAADLFFITSYVFILEAHKLSGRTAKLKVPVVIGNVEPGVKGLPSTTFTSADNHIEFRISDFPEETEGFKPAYVTYVT